MEQWSDGPGVIELPSGRRVRGRGLRRPVPPGQVPQFGVYLLAKAPRDLAWDHRWVKCRDFRIPSDTPYALSTLREAWHRAGIERVEVGCGGGVGRTGLALAVLAILDGIDPDDAVDWVRSRYNARAVETPWQRRWITRLRTDAS